MKRKQQNKSRERNNLIDAQKNPWRKYQLLRNTEKNNNKRPNIGTGNKNNKT